MKDAFLQPYIDELYEELLNKASNLDFNIINRSMKNKLRQYVGVASSQNWEERKVKDRYYFYSAEELNKAIREFFQNPYNLKVLARQSILLDEDDLIIESLDLDHPLGEVEVKGCRKQTKVIELVMRVRAFGGRNPLTGMPFDLLAIRLIYDGEPEEELRKEEEKSTPSDYDYPEKMDNVEQLTIFSILPAVT